MAFDFFSKNGKILPIKEAKISLSSIEYAYGFGVYETVRVKNEIPTFLSDHTERLLISAEIIQLTHSFLKKDIERYIKKLISHTKAQTYNIKILLIGASKPEDASLYITCSNPTYPERSWYRDGVKVITSNFERALPHSKSLDRQK